MSTTTDTTDFGEVAAIAEILDRMVAVEDWTLSDDQVVAELDGLGIQLERMAGLRLRRAGAAESRGICKARGWTTADHLMISDRTTLRAARAYVYFSRNLARFDLIGDAVCAGSVSTDQAQAMLHGLKHLPDEATDEQLVWVQQVLIAEAAELHPNDLRFLANHAVAVLFPEVEEDRLNKLLEREEARERRDRFLTFGRTPSGGVRFKGQLSALDGEKVMALITAYAQQLKRNHAQSVDRLDPEAETPTSAQFEADALAAIIDEVFGRQCAPTSGGDRPRVSLLLDYNALVNGTGTATLLGSGEPIPAETARHLACDADVIPVVLNSAGAVLDAGRTQRLFPKDVRHALEVRDQGCVFPNCEEPPQRCEAHHLVPWHTGGPSAYENGALLCQHHHRLVEPDPNAPEGSRWTIALDHHGLPHVFPPIRVDPERKPRQHTRFRQRFRHRE